MPRFSAPSPALSLTLVAAVVTLSCGCSDSSSGFFGSRMSVVDTSPPDSSADVPPDSEVTARFSAAVNPDTVSTATFRVVGSSSGPVAGTFRLEEDDRLVIFVPDAPFQEGEEVTVTLTSDILGQSGVSSPNRSFRFTVEGESPGPGAGSGFVVVDSAPEPHEVDVPVDTEIVVTFDTDLDPASVSADSVALVGELSGVVPATLVTDAAQLTLRPERTFLPHEAVSVQLATSLTALDGRSFFGETFRFRTSAGPSATPELARGADVPLAGEADSLRAADLDLDGDLDLVAWSSGSQQLEILVGLGDGEFQSQAPIATGEEILALLVVDLDGNGRLDLVVGTAERLLLYQFADAQKGVVETIEYGDPVPVHVGAAVRSLASGDLDHASVRLPDFVVDTESGVRVHRAGLGGAPVQTLGSSRLPRTPILLGDLALSDVALDSASDGSLDLVYGAAVGDVVSAHRFAPDGGEFRPPTTFALSGDALEVHVEDLDRDGELDILALVGLADGTEAIELARSSDAGSTADAPELLPNLGVSTLAPADLDGDGWTDIVRANPESATLGYWRNAGGSFDFASGLEELLAGEPVETPVVADFNGDSKLDIIAAAGDHLVTLLSGPGSDPPVPTPSTLTLPDVEALPGETGVTVPVSLSSEIEIDAFTVTVDYDPQAVTATGIDLTGSASEALVPFFEATLPDATEGWISYSVIFSPVLPGNTLPPGEDLTILSILFDVLPEAAAAVSLLTFLEEAADPAVETSLIAGGEPVPFVAVDGTFRVVVDDTPPRIAASVPAVTAHQGESGVVFEVLLENEGPLDVLTLVVGFDPAVVSARSIDLSGSLVETLAPPHEEELDRAAGWAALDVVFADPVLGGTPLPPGARTAFRVVFDVPAGAPEGEHEISFLAGPVGTGLRTRALSGGEEWPIETPSGTIVVEDNPNRLEVGDVVVSAGAIAAEATVFLTTVEPIIAFTVVGTYDPANLQVVGFDIEGTATAGTAPEFEAPDAPVGEGYFSYSVVFDFFPPFDDKVIPPGESIPILHLLLDVPESTPPGEYSLDLFNYFGDSVLPNSLVVDASRVLAPELVGGTVRVTVGESTFLRGDVDLSEKVDLTDYFVLQSYLTGGGATPVCLDAADVDDSGVIDADDVTTLLRFLYEGAAIPPPAPGQPPGTDPSDDPLDCAQGLD